MIVNTKCQSTFVDSNINTKRTAITVNANANIRPKLQLMGGERTAWMAQRTMLYNPNDYSFQYALRNSPSFRAWQQTSGPQSRGLPHKMKKKQLPQVHRPKNKVERILTSLNLHSWPSRLLLASSGNPHLLGNLRRWPGLGKT